MDSETGWQWASLLVRWAHIFAAILWIGSTGLFAWMDKVFTRSMAGDPSETVDGNLWMVHSGGFYVVEKRKIPQQVPDNIHWFKHEALATWLTGFLLLLLVYYRGDALVDANVRTLGAGTAAGIGLGSLLVAWLVYDALWASDWAQANEGGGIAVSFLLLVGAVWFYCHMFSGRAAYIHVGAMLGTLMFLNVWGRILPNQRTMIAQVTSGQPMDVGLGERAKQRSRHNTYMVMPVIIIMVSNHYPTLSYGQGESGWLILVGLIVLGWIGAKLLGR